MVNLGKSGGGSTESYVWNPQQKYLESLYEQGEDIYNTNNLDVSNFADSFIKQNMPAVNQAIDSAGNTDFLDSITAGTNLGMTGLSNLIDFENNPYLEDTVNNMWRSTSRNLGENILPQLRSEASVLGNYGGDRDQIAEGMATQEAIRNAGEMESDLRFNAYNSDLNRSLNASNAYTSQGLNADAASLFRANQLPGIVESSMNLGLTPQQVQFDYLDNLRRIIGQPVTMQQGSQDSGFNFGIG